MVDKDVILAKAGSVEKHTNRIQNIISGISLDFKRAFALSQNDINDLKEFLKAVMQKI